MAIVSKINIANSQLNNCDDISKCFTDMITNKTEDCDKFRVEFDRYDPKSLKKKFRSNETEGLSAVHYKVSDTARIIHCLTKQSLSSILTYNKRVCHCTWKLSTNKWSKPKQTTRKLQWRRTKNIGIDWHAIDVKKRDLFSKLVVMCSDTDVLLILHYFEMTSSSTIFKTTEHKCIFWKTYENLTPDICKAFLGFYALKGIKKFLRVVDQDIEEVYKYWSVTMKNKALKTLKMKIFNIIKSVI